MQRRAIRQNAAVRETEIKADEKKEELRKVRSKKQLLQFAGASPPCPLIGISIPHNYHNYVKRLNVTVTFFSCFKFILQLNLMRLIV